jgi:RND family efflux transporter MFP subunit
MFKRLNSVAMAVAAIGLIGLGGCGKSKVAEPPVLSAVEVVAVRAPRDGMVISATGALRRSREMVLSFRVPGVIIQMGADDGDKVVAGQVLARLDPTAVQARLNQAATDLERARQDEARYTTLASSGYVSRQRVEAQAALVASARAAYDAAAFDRRWANLVAPASGVVLVRMAQTGEVVQPGQAVMTLADETSPLVLRAPMSDRDIGKVALGAAATVRLDALPGQTLQGQITRIGQKAGAQSGAVEIEITLPSSPALRSGQIATAQITLTAPPKSDTAAAFARLPAEAILEANGPRAYVMTFDKRAAKARRTAVGFGGFDGDDALVSGLASDTMVITAGAGFVSDGQAVRVVNAAALTAKSNSQ